MARPDIAIQQTWPMIGGVAFGRWKSQGHNDRQLFEKQVMCGGLLDCLGEHKVWHRLERVNMANETLDMEKEDFDSKLEGCVNHVIHPAMRAMTGAEPGLGSSATQNMPKFTTSSCVPSRLKPVFQMLTNVWEEPGFLAGCSVMQNMPKLTGGHVEDTSIRSSCCWESFDGGVGIHAGRYTKELWLFKSVAPALATGCFFRIKPEGQVNPYQVVVYTWDRGNRYRVGVIDDGLSSSVARRIDLGTYQDSDLLEVIRHVEGLLSDK
jgi:hypothetical protein